jgi:hypothetical protein
VSSVRESLKTVGEDGKIDEKKDEKKEKNRKG